MSRSLNKVMLLGNVGSDPEVRSVGNGGRVASFSLATGRQWTDASGAKQEKTEWHKCIAWDAAKGQKLADIVEKYVRKGERIYVEGEIEYRQWQDKEGQTRYTTEIKVRELMLLGSKQGEGAAPTSGGAREPVRTRPAGVAGGDVFSEDGDDGLPF